MADLSDGVIALPGGCGTLEELLEIITWKQLSLYNKPIVIFNINGFFDSILQQLEHCIAQQFMKPTHKHLWFTAHNVQQIVDYIESYDEQAAPVVESKY